MIGGLLSMKNSLMRKDDSIIRILDIKDDKIFVIDCIKKTMPKWYDISFVSEYEQCSEFDINKEDLDLNLKRIMHERFTLVAGILPFVSDKKMRNEMISKIAEQSNDLIPILLYLLKTAPKNEILESKLQLAQMCGFFNYEMSGKREIEDYVEYRDEIKNKLPDKYYFKVNMDSFTYCTYTNQIKRNAYATIASTLSVLQKLNLLQYKLVNAGLIFTGGIVQKYELDIYEEKCYKECVDEACKKVLPLYNASSKIPKESIKPKDFMYKHHIREAYYDILQEIVPKKLECDMVIEHFSIYLKDSSFENAVLFDTIEATADYADHIQTINETFVKTLKSNAEKILKKQKNYYIKARDISLVTVEKFKDTTDGKKEKKEDEKYYNKSEIIDLLVSLEPTTEIIDLDEYEEKYYKDDGIFEDTEFNGKDNDIMEDFMKMFTVDE